MRCWKLNIFLIIFLTAVYTLAQSGRASKSATSEADTVLSVTAVRKSNPESLIRADEVFLYENGIEQKIRNFVFDPSPSRIVLLVDNSQTLKASVEKLQSAVKEFAYEIYEGDQIFIAAYDEKPEIVQEWTDDAKKIESSVSLFRKKGNPYLFDAISAVVREVFLPLMPGTKKTALVIIGDGLDRGSRISFEKVLEELQSYDITVYFLQIPDRSGGAYRRNQPKAEQVVRILTESTGGVVFEFEKASEAAKSICDELRKNRYLLSYTSTNPASIEPRRIFLVGQQEDITLRSKMFHPPTIKF
ncbi:MAG: VWA domain-containing protein [Pyrinomonadaceae bacterium]|nr:VWA domain-containing protein [Pyrinomonadaceae bacterium]MCX7638944.1 VWA domain-containing protein [Pyrinomonadaceae bacterium]MDW8304919.1 VWA domain-containing protein [Acidobacteriota bacterium]